MCSFNNQNLVNNHVPSMTEASISSRFSSLSNFITRIVDYRMRNLGNNFTNVFCVPVDRFDSVTFARDFATVSHKTISKGLPIQHPVYIQFEKGG